MELEREVSTNFDRIAKRLQRQTQIRMTDSITATKVKNDIFYEIGQLTEG